MDALWSPKWVEKEKRKKLEKQIHEKIIEKYSFDSLIIQFTLKDVVPEDLRKELEYWYKDAGWDEVRITEEDAGGFSYTNVYLKRKEL